MFVVVGGVGDIFVEWFEYYFFWYVVDGQVEVLFVVVFYVDFGDVDVVGFVVYVDDEFGWGVFCVSGGDVFVGGNWQQFFGFQGVGFMFFEEFVFDVWEYCVGEYVFFGFGQVVDFVVQFVQFWFDQVGWVYVDDFFVVDGLVLQLFVDFVGGFVIMVLQVQFYFVGDGFVVFVGEYVEECLGVDDL